MLDIQVIRQDPDRFRTSMRDKGYRDVTVIDEALGLDAERRSIVTSLQEVRERSNAIAKEVGTLFKSGRKDQAERLKRESADLKETIRSGEERLREVEAGLETAMLSIPNAAHTSIPVGTSPADNLVAFESGTPPVFGFEPQPHWVLLERHGLVDFARGAKVTGAGFPFYVGEGARLQRSLIQFFLDMAVTSGGYTEVEPPIVVNADSARGTGQLPDKEDQMYEIVRDGLYAIPTAEVPVTNLHRDEILSEADLPIRYCAYSPCFRREAGSYGKDVRGLNRLHQFDKVELVQVVHPDRSYEALESLREDAERLLQLLDLPYRRVVLCTGDMGFAQSKTYDLEVWSAAQERWLEVSSISNYEAFQARRMRIRYRPSDGGRPEFVHTLNGSALALPRIVAALVENNQREDGSIDVPEVLRPYTRFDRIG